MPVIQSPQPHGPQYTNATVNEMWRVAGCRGMSGAAEWSAAFKAALARLGYTDVSTFSAASPPYVAGNEAFLHYRVLCERMAAAGLRAAARPQIVHPRISGAPTLHGIGNYYDE